MGPILQYVLLVPIGIVLFLWGVRAVYKSYAKAGSPDAPADFSLTRLWFSGVVAAVLGAAIVYAVLFEGLSFGGPGRYGS